MGRIRHILAAMVVLLACAAASAEAVTVRDIIELSKAGLGDDVLLALIEVDRPVFSIDTATLKSLKDAGVSQQVIVAMIRSGRTPAPEPPPQPAPAETMVPPDTMQVEPGMDPSMGYPPPPQVVEVPVAVPVAVPVPVYVNAPRHRAPVHQNPDVPLNHAIQLPFGPNNNPGILGGNNLSPQHSDLSPRNSDLSPKPQSGHCTQPVYWGNGGKLRSGSWQPPSSCQ
jgi:hypothetical protein